MQKIKAKILSSHRLFYLYQGVKGFLLGMPVKNNYTPNPFVDIQALVSPRPSTVKKLRLNLLINTINKKQSYGGVNTALEFFNSLAQYCSSIRIITLAASPTRETLEQYSDYQWISLDEDSDTAKQIISLVDHQDKTLPVGEGDVFIATVWYTAYFAQQLVQWQSENFQQNLKPFVYFIQDYEPGFYPWSSQYLLARNTYQYQDPAIAVYNTQLLQEYFHLHNYKFDYEYSFEPTMNSTLLQSLQNLRNCPKKKQILVYGRPSTPRNAFELIIEGLKIWQKTFPSYLEWTILSAGESHPDVFLNEKQCIRSLGKLSLEDYALCLGQSSIGLSFMVSPHPSYPPLEMSHYGMFVITNEYDNKNLSLWHENIISLRDIYPEKIANTLTQLCQKIENDPTSGWRGQSSISNYLKPDRKFAFCEDIYQHLMNN